MYTEKYVLVKMMANQTEYSRLEQRFVIKFLVAKKCKPCEIYRKMCDVYREVCFGQNDGKSNRVFQA